MDSIPVDGNNSGALPDILVSDDTGIRMRQLSFDRTLQTAREGKPGSF